MNLKDTAILLGTLSPKQREAHEAVVTAYKDEIEEYKKSVLEEKRCAMDERMKRLDQEATCTAIAQGCVETLLAAAIIIAVRSRRCPAISWAAGFAAGGCIGYRVCNYLGLPWSLKSALRARNHRKSREREEREAFIRAAKNDQETEGSRKEKRIPPKKQEEMQNEIEFIRARMNGVAHDLNKMKDTLESL